MGCNLYHRISPDAITYCPFVTGDFHLHGALSHRFAARSHHFAVMLHRHGALSHCFAALLHHFTAMSHRIGAMSHQFGVMFHRGGA